MFQISEVVKMDRILMVFANEESETVRIEVGGFFQIAGMDLLSFYSIMPKRDHIFFDCIFKWISAARS